MPIDKPYEKGMVLFRQRRYRQAIPYFQGALAAEPNSARAHAMLGLSYYNDKQYPPAHASASEAIRIDPSYAFAYYVMSHAQTQFPIARPTRSFTLSVSRSRGAPDARRRYKTALKTIEQAIALNPTSADYLAHHAALLAGLGRWGASLASTERGLQHNPNHIDCSNQRALALKQLGRLDDANLEVSRSLGLNPEHAVTHRLRGWFSLESGSSKRAVAHFLEALRIDPSNANAKKGLYHARLASRFPPYGWFAPFWLFLGSRLGRGVRLAIFVGSWLTFLCLRDSTPWAFVYAVLVFLGSLTIGSFALRLVRRFRGRQARSMNRFGPTTIR